MINEPVESLAVPKLQPTPQPGLNFAVKKKAAYPVIMVTIFLTIGLPLLISLIGKTIFDSLFIFFFSFILFTPPILIILLPRIKAGDISVLNHRFALLNNLTYEKISALYPRLVRIIAQQDAVLHLVEIPDKNGPIHLYNLATRGPHGDTSPLSEHYKLLTTAISMPLETGISGLIIRSKKYREKHMNHYTNVQKITLEGDFNKYFIVYAQKGLENEALRILNPLIMTCLKDHATGMSIEFHPHNVLVYLNEPASTGKDLQRLFTTSQQLVQRLQRIASLIVDDTHQLNLRNQPIGSRWGIMKIAAISIAVIYCIFAIAHQIFG